jgi:hypothetical protein
MLYSVQAFLRFWHPNRNITYSYVLRYRYLPNIGADEMQSLSTEEKFCLVWRHRFGQYRHQVAMLVEHNEVLPKKKRPTILSLSISDLCTRENKLLSRNILQPYDSRLKFFK